LTKYNGASLPTVGFAIDFDLEDDIFEQMQHPIAEIKVTKNIIKGNVKIPSKGEMAIDKLKNQ
jgi:DNA-binding transcriptional regulator YhcF (GntR family)